MNTADLKLTTQELAEVLGIRAGSIYNMHSAGVDDVFKLTL